MGAGTNDKPYSKEEYKALQKQAEKVIFEEAKKILGPPCYHFSGSFCLNQYKFRAVSTCPYQGRGKDFCLFYRRSKEIE